MYVQLSLLFLSLTNSYYNTDDQHNTTTVTITHDQAIVWRLNPIPLPVFEVDVDKIVVNFPCKFKSMNLKRNNVQPTEKSVVPIEILYHCD